MKTAGVTLIELVIVLAVIALVAALSIPRGREVLQAYELRAAAELVASELGAARARAVSHNVSISFRLDASGSSYALVPVGESVEQWSRLPGGVTIQSRQRLPITFYSRGSAVPAGTLELTSPAGTVAVMVAPMGRIRWEWRDHG